MARVPQRDFHASFGFDALGRPVAPVTATAEAAADPGDGGEAAAAAAAAEQKVEELFYRSLYLPEQGMFAELPTDLRLGTRLPVPEP